MCDCNINEVPTPTITEQNPYAEEKNTVIKTCKRIEMLRFIQECVKHKPLFYTDSKNETRSTKMERNAALDQISNALNIPGFGPKEVYAKFRNAKSNYRQEVKKTERAVARGLKYKSQLIYFTTLDKACQEFNKDIKPSEENSIDMDVSTSIQNENNTNYLVKLEFEEGECADEQNQVDDDKISIIRENPETAVDNTPYITNYANCVTDVTDSRSNSHDYGEGTNNQISVRNEFDVFGESIAAQLKNMPLPEALEAQMYIQNYLSTLRLQALRQQIPN